MLAVTHTFFETIGAHYIIGLKDSIKNRIIREHNLRNRKGMLRARYLRFTPYDSDALSVRARVGKEQLGLDHTWKKGTYYIEAHESSHFHHDFSIVVNGKVYRMARTPSKNNTKSGMMGLFPGPGEKTSWTMQPEHYPHEVPNPAVIDDGYGAGTSKVIAKGDCFVRTSHNGNVEIILDKSEAVYSFIEKEDGQVLVIRKGTLKPNHPSGKHKMKTGKFSDLPVLFGSDKYIAVKKYNGAAVEWEVYKDPNGVKHLKIWSWRPDKKLAKKYGIDAQIEHTYRLNMASKKLPSDFPVCAGKGELFIDGNKGMGKVTVLLNSTVYNGVANKHEQPVLVVHDITYHESYHKVSDMKYSDKLKLIEELSRRDERFITPEYAISEGDKYNLWFEAKDESIIYDGLIFWNEEDPSASGIKMKFKHDESSYHNAVIVRIEPQTGEHGDKFGYPVVQNEMGAEFKLAGKGLTHQTKADMFKYPGKYVGSGVVYSAEHHFEKTGKPFQPLLIRVEIEEEKLL